MGNFGRDNRSGGRDFNSRGSYGGGRGSDRPTMHKTTCSNCGKECEVPFRPTGAKPVFCNDCFRNNGASDSRRSNDRDSRREDRPMFQVVCANCGNDCRVPFEPREGKQVLCSNCFEKNGGDPRRANNAGSSNKEQFDAINAKLDAIMALLAPEAAVVEEKPKKAKKVKAESNSVSMNDDEATSDVAIDISSEIESESNDVVTEEIAEKPKVAKKPRAKKA